LKYKNEVDEWSIYYNSNAHFEEVAFGISNEYETLNKELLESFKGEIDDN